MTSVNPQYLLSSYGYVLPEANIAQLPVHPPESAKLVVVNPHFTTTTFSQLPSIIPKDSLLFLNDTRVLPARIRSSAKIVRPSGTVQNREIELLYLDSKEGTNVFESMVFPGDAFPVGSVVTIGNFQLKTLEITYRGRVFSIESEGSVMDFLDNYGEYPIPPYISSSEEAQKEYQTCFAHKPGSLAAPTASLHFSQELLASLTAAQIQIHYATLHVGIGTFKIVNETDIRKHRIHPEIGSVPLEYFSTIANAQMQQKNCIAVGTTMTRLLESLPFVWHSLSNQLTASEYSNFLAHFSQDVIDWWNNRYIFAKKYEEDRIAYLSEFFPDEDHRFVRIVDVSDLEVVFDSSLYIYDGYTPSVATAMITNFHLPESTLLMMVSALGGRDVIRALYEFALNQDCRFYSFGDGCFIPFQTYKNTDSNE